MVGLMWSLLAATGMHAEDAKKPEPGALEFPAWVFDRGNAQVLANSDSPIHYKDKWPELLVGDGGTTPWLVEYDIELPLDTTYTVSVRYIADEPRPLELWLDGRLVGTCCTATTSKPPGFTPNPYYQKQTDGLPLRPVPQWAEAAKLRLAKGPHTLKLTCGGLPPNVTALRLESSEPFPEGWLPTGPGIQLPDDRRELLALVAHGRKPAWKPVGQLEKIDRLPAIYRTCFLPPDAVNPATLRLAITAMIARFGERYPQGPQYLQRLDELAKQRKDIYARTPVFDPQIETAFEDLRREAMLKHPLLDFDKLLFVKRPPAETDHIYTEYEVGTRMGGNLCILSPVAPDGKVTEIAPQLSGGLFSGFDLSFDARKIVFTYAKAPGDEFHIYEIGVDGTGLRQLTPSCGRNEGGQNEYLHFSDVDPCYLPDGKIMFVSTRCKRNALCFGSAVQSLYVMDADGSNMHGLSGSPLNEMTPSLLDDGRVIYTRWEYVDKPLSSVQSLWSVRPDGSHSTHVYKNDVAIPYGLMHARSIPGSTRVVAIGTGHCDPAVGPVILIDNDRDRRTSAPMTSITPELGMPFMFNQRAVKEFGYFKTPVALSQECFLVSHNPVSRPGLYPKEALAGKHQIQRCESNIKGYGIYLLDAWGNRAELYRDPEISCFQPMPLRPRNMPNEIAGVVTSGAEPQKLPEKLPQKPATVFMQDVYQGMTGIERGRVKYLRVMEAIGVSWDEAMRGLKNNDRSWGQRQIVSDGIDIHMKKIHGIATVQDDGSALFTVPANRNIFFQALDENYMELQRMRTFVNFMPGEKRSCIGCHEPRQLAPARPPARPLATQHPVEELRPQPGDTKPRAVHYAADVVPILQRRCVGCHGGKEPAGGLALTSELTGHFDKSYENLLGKNLVGHVITSVSLPPLTFGSHQSGLVRRIREAPCNAGLTREGVHPDRHLGRCRCPVLRHARWQEEPHMEGRRGVPSAAALTQLMGDLESVSGAEMEEKTGPFVYLRLHLPKDSIDSFFH